MYRRKYKVGQKLRKVFDGRIVTVAEVRGKCIVLDGDFEPKHVVMDYKAHHYYKVTEEGN